MINLNLIGLVYTLVEKEDNLFISLETTISTLGLILKLEGLVCDSNEILSCVVTYIPSNNLLTTTLPNITLELQQELLTFLNKVTDKIYNQLGIPRS